MNPESSIVKTSSRTPQFIAFLLSAIISSVPHPGFQELFRAPPVYAPETHTFIALWLLSLTVLTACMIALTTLEKLTCFLLIVAGFSLAQAIGNLLWLGYWLAPELHLRFFLGSITQSSVAAAIGLIFGSIFRKRSGEQAPNHAA
jgi:hypothetical protein